MKGNKEVDKKSLISNLFMAISFIGIDFVVIMYNYNRMRTVADPGKVLNSFYYWTIVIFLIQMVIAYLVYRNIKLNKLKSNKYLFIVWLIILVVHLLTSIFAFHWYGLLLLIPIFVLFYLYGYTTTKIKG